MTNPSRLQTVKEFAPLAGGLLVVACVIGVAWYLQPKSIDQAEFVALVRDGHVRTVTAFDRRLVVRTDDGKYEVSKEPGTDVRGLLAQSGVPADRIAAVEVVVRPQLWDQPWVVIGVLVVVCTFAALGALVFYLALRGSRLEAARTVLGGVSAAAADIGRAVAQAQHEIDKSERQRQKKEKEKDTKVPLPQTRFSDIAGYDAVKAELSELVQYLRCPALSRSTGIEAPRHVLLVGPPGTGKTLFARAVAQAAGAEVFYASGSEFVEMYVGVGADRVRNLFEKAGNGPALIFIDELDALARRRSGRGGGQTQEHDNTLNELLTRLDGFVTAKDRRLVFVGATNREDVLDPALLQRMHRRVTVPLPGAADRAAILALYADRRGLAWTPAEHRETVAQTAGFAGRQLANLIDEAGRQAVARVAAAALADCRAYPAGGPDEGFSVPRRVPWPDRLIPCGGRCRPGGAAEVTFTHTGTAAVERFTFHDDQAAGFWCGVIHLEPGTYDVGCVVDGAAQPGFSFEVTAGNPPVAYDDIRRALRRIGTYLPRAADARLWRDELDRHAAGNADTKDECVRAAALHYAGVRVGLERPGYDPSRPVLVLSGPAGAGKTTLARGLAAALGVPFTVCDAAALVAARDGAYGLLRRHLRTAGGDVARAQYGILCVERADRDRSVPGRGWEWLAQPGMAELLDGSPLELPRSTYAEEPTVFETKGIFLVIESGHPPGADGRSVGWPAALRSRVAAVAPARCLSAEEWARALDSPEPLNPLLRCEPMWESQGLAPAFVPDGRAALAAILAERQGQPNGVDGALARLTAWFMVNASQPQFAVTAAVVDDAFGRQRSTSTPPPVVAPKGRPDEERLIAALLDDEPT